MLELLVQNANQIDVLNKFIVLVGVPIAIFQFGWKIYRERKDRAYGTFDALDDRYIEFEMLCLQHPELDVFDLPDASPKVLSPLEAKQELAAFLILLSIFERAYLMYRQQPTRLASRQWKGWETHINDYCMRVNFRRAWKSCGASFDGEFEKFMKSKIDAYESR